MFMCEPCRVTSPDPGKPAAAASGKQARRTDDGMFFCFPGTAGAGVFYKNVTDSVPKGVYEPKGIML